LPKCGNINQATYMKICALEMKLEHSGSAIKDSEGGRHGGRPTGAQAEDAQGAIACEHLISQFLAARLP
jgi:hypothetical protein